MKTKSKKRKKRLLILIMFLSIYTTYKYLEKKKVEITDKEFQEIDKFCNPTPVSPWWISLCVFSSLVILEGLTLVGIHLFLK